MFEIVWLLSMLGMLLASVGRLKSGNPFQVYFAVWSTIFSLYAVSRTSWVEVDDLFWLTMAVSHSIWLAGMVVFRRHLVSVPSQAHFDVRLIRRRPLFIAQALCLAFFPFAYSSALEISGGVTLFDHEAYRQLRYGISYGGVGYGWSSYLILLSFLVTSLTLILWSFRRVSVTRVCLSLAVSLGYAFISTGRTYILLLAILVVAPLFLLGRIRWRGIAVSGAGLLVLFMFSAALTGKGASLNARIYDNVVEFIYHGRAYTVAPFIAFSELIGEPRSPSLGAYSFRFFSVLANAIGWGGDGAPDLVREYRFVPDATNVYTVFDPYFRDFGFFGVMVSIFVMLLHVWLYVRMGRGRRGALIFYSLSLYPLLMQFFQDQYASLFSTWVQAVFWVALLVGPPLRIHTGKTADV